MRGNGEKVIDDAKGRANETIGSGRVEAKAKKQKTERTKNGGDVGWVTLVVEKRTDRDRDVRGLLLLMVFDGVVECLRLVLVVGVHTWFTQTPRPAGVVQAPPWPPRSSR